MNRALFLSVLLAPAALTQGPPPPPPPLQPPPVPPQNLITPQKAVLGKILYWDEQLSSDNTVACGTCHFPTVGGAEARIARNPGRDGQVNTADDIFGSPGVVRAGQDKAWKPDATFGLNRQITGRAAPNFFMGAYSPGRLFWDGRAQGPFNDPITNVTLIPLGAALEIQVLAPPTSDVEMGHEGRNWAEIATKMAGVAPLRLATNLPPDVSAALAANPTYPALFQAAFGDPAVTPARIAMAIATYERTLVPNRAPIDLGTLTAAQLRGSNVFGGNACAACHGGSAFTDNQFHNTGVRPIAEDSGRQAVTGNPADAGRFKTPSLRNVGLKRRLQHSGLRGTLEEVVDFYIRGGDFRQNIDPLMVPRPIGPGARADLLDFLRNGLTDPRVAQGLPPFDRPTLRSELLPNGDLYGQGTPGTGGAVPFVLGHLPAFRGNDAFQVGLARGLGGAPAVLALAGGAANLQIGNIPLLVDPFTVFVLQVFPGLSGPPLGGQGFATLQMPIPNDAALSGEFVSQWFVVDPAGPDGVAVSGGARFTIF